MTTMSHLAVGDRVAVNEAHWLARAGAPSGVVVKLGRTKAHIRADVNGVVYAVTASALTAVAGES